MADPRVEAVAEALRAEGADTNIHGWRCEYPDRYGPCDCVTEAAKAAVAALDAYTARETVDRLAAEHLGAER